MNIRRTLWWCSGLLLALALMPARTHGQTPPAGTVTELAGSTPGHVFAATECGAYEQTSGGTRWAKIGGVDGQIFNLVRLQGDVLLGLVGSNVYRRAPGEAWQAVAEVGPTATLTTNPAATRAYMLFGFDQPHLMRSDDGGRTWLDMPMPRSSGDPRDIAVATDPATGQDVLLVALGLPGREGGGSTLVRSVDGGALWLEVPDYAGSPPSRTNGLALSVGSNGTTFYLSAYSAFEGGQLYQLAAPGFGLSSLSLPRQLQTEGVREVVAYDNTLILIGFASAYISRAGGTFDSFSEYNQGITGLRTFDVLYTSTGDRALLYIATSAGVFQRDPLAGSVWVPNSGGLPLCGSVDLAPYLPINPFPDTPTRRYFPETHHSLSNGFKAFWERNGGLAVFGFPLSEEFDELNVDLRQNFTTQYFERERFEYHPEQREPYTVLLGRLGDELLKAQGRDWRTEGGGDNPFAGTSCQTFTIEGQQRQVCGPFLNYWRSHGLEFDGRSGVAYNESLALFGLPLTAPRLEQNPDGARVITQWFERARFEYHPNQPDPYKVLLGRLGSEVLKLRGVQAP